jgi:hypothetical protein
MTKFTKTTEIDISAMHDVIEEDTPKRSKLSFILPIIISIVLAFFVWIYVTENSDDVKKKTFTSVEVPNEEITLNIEVEGTYSALADIDQDSFEITKKDDEYVVVIKSTASDNAKTASVISYEINQ